MQSKHNVVDIAASSVEGYLPLHDYWLQARVVGQDSNRHSDDTKSSSSVSARKEQSGAREPIGSYYFSEPMIPIASRSPLVEDDEEEGETERNTNHCENGGEGAAFDYFLNEGGTGGSSLPVGSRKQSASFAAVARHSAGDALPGAISKREIVPVLEEESLGDLGDVIGYGGDRGSFVCRVAFPTLLDVFQSRAPSYASPCSLSSPLRREREAYKRYPTQISADELSFVSTAYRCASNSAHCQSTHSPFLTEEEAQYAALHLVLPDAIVAQDNKKVGLLMPLYNCSLKEFLQSLKLKPQHVTTPASDSHVASIYLEDTFSEDGPHGAFNSAVRYCPVDSIEVIYCIAFQVLEAVAYLNHRLPHGGNSRGYTHNDLHLDNVLLSYDGDVALCDFELVASTPNPTHNAEVRRLPPSTRQSPHGLFSETADTWAFGLMLVGLLTGVDPLFTINIVNDFCDGPQLSRWDLAVCVLDWESNIKAHVEGLLRVQDPTGKRLNEARGLLNICGKCLVNREGAEPLCAIDLLEEPQFQVYRKDFRLATRTIKAWAAGKRW
ncbi:hypothetical protein ABL78_0066 [Leptomonas seymouri]|uniref:Protein kinase domain-containing protein n=1 Tax=Leptomonas seymouri TaxID=5684 RepID=A0A0N1PEH1_LEPSE|nr:hypothetical protein ABL78_0066 [Leptomonas seymouri]|eukprot:KPI90833.1 hypothetical protein ABL78_0066 [Leptomonas seymouri]